MNRLFRLMVVMIMATSCFAEGGYVFRNETLNPVTLSTKTNTLNYTPYIPDVSAIGMGGIRTANASYTLGMLSNPAQLANKDKKFDVFGLQMSFPKSTWDAAWFMEDHMDEFIEATSLNQVWDGVNAFFAPGSNLESKWNALQDIQDGMAFAVDLLNEVTGPPNAPERYGFNILPAFGGQIGNWGFSLYGYGQASFMIRQSPTLDALVNVDIPENLDTPLQAAQSVLQIMGILGTGIIKDSQTFSQEIFPVAFYLSFMDVVGTVGYGKSLGDKINAGANLKIINRRFSLDRIPVVDYDAIIENTFDDLSESVTGVTADLGMQYKLGTKTQLGLSLINVLPVQSLDDNITMDFFNQQTGYDRENGQKQVDANGDTMMVRYKRQVYLSLPFELKLPFLLNIGFHHKMTDNWTVGLDWIDILENDTRYTSTMGRLRLGTQYQYTLWEDKLNISGRLGFGDEHICGGLGFQIYDHLLLDGAYAWDPVIEAYSYYTQLRIVL